MSDSEQPTQDVGAEASVEDAPPPAAGDGEAGSDAGSDVDNSALFGGSDSDDDDDGDAAAPSASAETGDAAGGEDAVGAGGGGSDDDEKLFGSDSDDDAAGGGSGSGSGSGSGAGAGAGAVVVDSDGNSDDGPNLVELPPPSGPRPLENPVNVRVLGEEVVPRPPEGALVQTVRLPSIVGIAPRHFDPDTWDEEAEKAALAKVGRGGAETLIRWRFKRNEDGSIARDADGPIRESNAKFVQWSDNSLQLLVGTRVFDVVQQKTRKEGRDFLYVAQPSDGDGNGPETVLMAHASVVNKMVIRPHRRAGELITNKALLDVTERTLKRKRTRKRAVVANPVTEKEAKISAIDRAIREEERQRRRAEQKQEQRTHRRRGRASAAHSTPGVRYDDDGMDISRIKMRGRGYVDDDDDDDDDEDDYRGRAIVDDDDAGEDGARRLEQAKRGNDSPVARRRPSSGRRGGSDDDADMVQDDDDDDDGDDGSSNASAGAGAGAGAGDDDDDDDDGAAAVAGRSKKRRMVMDDSDDDE